MKKFAIIVAGGTGKRMLNNLPKQFILLKQEPILLYSLKAFYNAIPQIEIIIVLPENHLQQWQQICDTYQINIPHKTVIGGSTRFESVKHGLDHTQDHGIVAIHDGARPLISKELILLSFSEAEKYGNAIPTIQIDHSVRIIQNEINKTINRKALRIIQTPQCFNLSLLKKAYQQKYIDSFTDDASVIENTGVSIHLIKGSRENIKITYPEDIAIASALLSK